jgi:Arc/MetJ-type ribon-helix-helix transcriptional regulator
MVKRKRRVPVGVKATFILDEEIMEKGRVLVKEKRFKSMNAFIDKAIRDELAALGKEEIKKALLEASKDPLFLADIKEVEKNFAHSDFEEGEK